jgi:type VI protein secretion system component Hcp
MTQTPQTANAISEREVSLENQVLKDDELDAVSGGGKVNTHDISITKYVDASSPVLMIYASK